MILLSAVLILSIQASRAPDTLPSPLVEARDSLRSGRIDAAIDLSKHYTRDHPNDPRGFIVLGDAYLVHLPWGRFEAWKAYRKAEQLAPNDPAAPYAMGTSGFILGGTDGERLAEKGYERVLELDPHYRDAWQRWLVLYRNDGDRSHMIARLGRHPDPEVESWIARLQIESNVYAAADSNLDSLIVRDPKNGSLYALRAQSAFEAGDSITGARYYRLALRHANNDPQGILWDQAVGIATPEDIRAWEAGVPAERRGAWFAAFWARRNPDLFTGMNHRLLEHFERLRVARHKYPLQHPLILYNRSREGRSLILTPSSLERQEYIACEASSDAGVISEEDERTLSIFGEARLLAPSFQYAAHTGHERGGHYLSATDDFGLPSGATLNSIGPFVMPSVPGLDLSDVDSTAARVGYNLSTGLSDQGIMYLRFGPPEKQLIGTDVNVRTQCAKVMDDVQRWYYPGMGWVRFATPPALDIGQAIGSPIFRPMNEEQFRLTALGLTRDASSVPATLSFGIWTAEFRNLKAPTRTDLAVITTVGEAAAELIDATAGPRGARIARNGHVTVTDAPGNYELVADARENGELGRTTMRVHLKTFAGPSVSDLLLSRAGPDSEVTRAEIFARVPRDLTFDATDTVRAYVEVYGVTPAEGRVKYRVRYALLKTGNPSEDARKAEWPHATTFAFSRDRAVDERGVAHEYLDLSPELLSSGRYLLRVSVRNATGGEVVGSALSELTIR